MGDDDHHMNAIPSQPARPDNLGAPTGSDARIGVDQRPRAMRLTGADGTGAPARSADIVLLAKCVQVLSQTCSIGVERDAWLRGAASALQLAFVRESGQPQPIGAWVAIVTRADGQQARTPLAMSVTGYAGFSPEQTEETALVVCSHPQTWAQSLADVVHTQALPFDEQRRQTMALGQFVRCVQPLGGASNELSLLWQVDGRAGGWTPSATDVQLAELLSGALAQLYTSTVLVREQARRRLCGMLSTSQAPILPLLAQGYSQRQIAERIKRSLHTVHDHVKSIYATLGISSRYQLYVLWQGGDPKSAPAGED
jgi:DNA-binding CsgD family transcriptional regulator